MSESHCSHRTGSRVADSAERLIVALDFASAERAGGFLKRAGDGVRTVKVGLELFTAEGPSVIQACGAPQRRVFLDLKFHDIPNTVAGAVRAATRLGVWMLNIHAAGGREMMRRAVESAGEEAVLRGIAKPLVVAVTLLTSIDDALLRSEVGVDRTALDHVLFLASQAEAAGADGVVCSPTEARAVRERFGPGFVIVTPGVRPRWAEKGDQRRAATPAEAIAAGADYLVVGRPITASADPAEALRRTLAEMGTALREC